MQYDFPQELISDLARQKCVVFVGSGASAGCVDDQGHTPPTWDKLIRYICEGAPASVMNEIESQLDRGNFLVAAEIAFREVNNDRLYTRLEEVLSKRYHPSNVHRALLDLDQRIYITTNYDTILETFFRNELSSGILVKTYTQNDIVASIRGNRKVLVKLHGTIDHRDSMVLTNDQYTKSRKHYDNFYTLLKSLVITNTVLFVGCGLSDPDIALLFEDLSIDFPGSPYHYMIREHNPKSSLSDEATSKSRNLKIVYYDLPHDNLPLLLAELAQASEIERKAPISF